MPLGQGIVEILEAIPVRIEVSGHAPTWQITGGSFDAVLAYAEETLDHPAVIASRRRDLFWTRVTLTVTTDPHVAAGAPSLDELRAESTRRHRADDPDPAALPRQSRGRSAAPRPSVPDPIPASLDELFERAEDEREARLRIPRQRD